MQEETPRAVSLMHLHHAPRIIVKKRDAAMKATNAPEADPLIRKPYRKGFELPV